MESTEAIVLAVVFVPNPIRPIVSQKFLISQAFFEGTIS